MKYSDTLVRIQDVKKIKLDVQHHHQIVATRPLRGMLRPETAVKRTASTLPHSTLRTPRLRRPTLTATTSTPSTIPTHRVSESWVRRGRDCRGAIFPRNANRSECAEPKRGTKPVQHGTYDIQNLLQICLTLAQCSTAWCAATDRREGGLDSEPPAPREE